MANHLFGTRTRTGILIINLILLAALAWWTFGLTEGPAGDTGPLPSPMDDQSTVATPPAPSRKSAPDLSDLLKTTQGFASRMDSTQDVTPKRRKSHVRAVSMERPAFDWNQFIVRGVVSGQGTNRYAIIEYAKTGEQVLVVEGGRLQNGAVLIEVGESHLVLEVDGQRKTTDVSIHPLRRRRERPDPRSLVKRD